jgi:hypothetical protein
MFWPNKQDSRRWRGILALLIGLAALAMMPDCAAAAPPMCWRKRRLHRQRLPFRRRRV